MGKDVFGCLPLPAALTRFVAVIIMYRLPES